MINSQQEIVQSHRNTTNNLLKRNILNMNLSFLQEKHNYKGPHLRLIATSKDIPLIKDNTLNKLIESNNYKDNLNNKNKSSKHSNNKLLTIR